MLHHANILAEANKTFSQDYRERTGRFFTPPQWVKLSQKYIADALGENWQEEYYVWDCAAGTGNLLAGLTNKYNIWASTIDQADVDVMKEWSTKGANLLENHLFQFDFLNDSFDKLPDPLREIVNDPEKRKKLLIYINPPYAEAGNRKQVSGTGVNKAGVAETEMYRKYQAQIGTAAREVFAQFLIRIYLEIPECKIGQFSKLKALQAENFKKFRTVFTPKLLSLFLIPADTFDNVKGKFPIGFFLWDTKIKSQFEKEIIVISDVYNHENKKKILYNYDVLTLIILWLRKYYDKTGNSIGYLRIAGTDIQNSNTIVVKNSLSSNEIKNTLFTPITHINLVEISIYYTVRGVILNTWLNANDYFLYPKDTWEKDTQFQTDCLAYTLFSNKNKISVKYGINHWIPFTEIEVRPKDNFASHFMTDYIQGKIKMNPEEKQALVEKNQKSSLPSAPLEFSPAAKAVFDAGRELWKYYQSKQDANPNAALYDIKEYFQGRNDKGRIKTKSNDEEYNRLLGILREKLKILADQIEPKVYEHGFLKLGQCCEKKKIYNYDRHKNVIYWLRNFYDKKSKCCAYLCMSGTDVQSSNSVFIINKLSENALRKTLFTTITALNVLEMGIYHTIRHVIPATWLNDRDQFLYPNDSWETDTQFQTNCLTWTLFNNNISITYGTNHWIPFTEMEVRPKDNFASHFMTDYIRGKITMNPEEKQVLVEKNQRSSLPSAPLEFSPAAQAVFDAGRELWKYYQSKPDANPNAALYDIKEYFQGRNDKGRIKTKSNDEEYNRLIGILREKLKILADQIEPKVYEHGFLKK